MIANLKESFLFERLPAGLINLDERGLIQALCGGLQSRIEDLRSYSDKLSLFYSVDGLPDPVNNVVSVVLTSPQGVVYKRSLDLKDDTPDASQTAALRTWAAEQVGLPEADLGSVQYDQDLLRYVDSSILDYLAATIGAILHESSLNQTSDAQQACYKKLVDTYFPRLRIKGTAGSFDVLGRALGFDDVRVTPLWTRMSPRMPQDIGNRLNDPDFAAEPDFYPQQTISALYDPLDVRDGPFYTWSGTCANGTASMAYYTNVVNGFNPWVEVVVLGSISNGTAVHVAPGTYALANGAPNLNAYVDAGTSSFRFEALCEGEAFNGVVITVGTVGVNGTARVLTISDRLSSIKYRSSYFDLGMTVDWDSAVEVFGTQPVSANKDIYDAYVVYGSTASSLYHPDGVAGSATSPYRPWIDGSLATSQVTSDFLTSTTVSAGTTVVSARIQASGTNQELIVDNFIAAGVQAVASLEEVRPATRFPRQALTGLLIDDPLRFACYVSVGTLFTTTAATSYTGSHALTPAGSYTAEVSLYIGTSAYAGTTSVSPLSNYVWSYYLDLSTYAVGAFATGTYSFTTGTYHYDLTGVPTGSSMVAVWTVSNTEVIRPEPSAAQKAALEFDCQARAEDDDNGIDNEPADEYPWLRQVVGGGELVEIDTYLPEAAPADRVAMETAFQDQTGVDLNVYGLHSQNGVLRLVIEDRPYDSTYAPGIRAVAYKGTFKDLSTLSASDTAFIRPSESGTPGTYAAKTDYDVLFNAGYGIYHAGIVQGVLVADPVKFFGSHHRTGLVGWLPLNEHPEEAISVTDQARTIAQTLVMTGVNSTDRVWDADRGWYLNLATGTVAVTSSRSIDESFSISFWLKPNSSSGTILDYYPLLIESLAGTGLCFYGRDANGTLTFTGSAGVATSAFNFVSVAYTSGSYRYGIGNLATPVTEVSVTGSFEKADVNNPSTLTFKGAGFHDLRIWNLSKSQTDFNLVRYHEAGTTVVLYPLGFIETANRGDRWGMRVLNNGWITPDVLSPWYHISQTALVRRYTSEGSYTGASRFKEVGLGDGHDLPTQIRLGYVIPSVEADGTAVMSGSWGQLPGVNSLWYSDTTALYPLDQCNPIRDRIWLKGTVGDAAIYEVTLQGTNSVTYLRGEAVYRGSISYSALGTNYPGTEQLTGAEVVLASDGYRAYYSASAGTVVQIADTGTTTPPQWLYLNQRTTDGYPGLSTWTRQGYTAHQQGVDITGNGTLVAVAGDVNSALLFPAIGDNGQLIFENSSSLAPGRYRLTIETGNAGLPDTDFEGFNVELSLNANLVQTTLLSGKSGFNVRGTDTVDLDIATPAVTGTWLFSLTWFNAARDTSKGTMRQLVVYNYRLERLATELFRIEINPAGSVPNVFPVIYDADAPGGWIRRVNSYGTVVEEAHEGTIYPANDTVIGRFPLGNILTGMTNDRREDVVVSGITPDSFRTNGTVSADASALVLPTFGSLNDSLA